MKKFTIRYLSTNGAWYVITVKAYDYEDACKKIDAKRSVVCFDDYVEGDLEDYREFTIESRREKRKKDKAKKAKAKKSV